MKATLKDVVLGTPAGIKAEEEALKKSCEDQVKLLKELKENNKMKNLTRNGVAKDLTKSPYTFTEFIEGKQLNLYFSSKLHLNKFIKKRDENYLMLYNHINKRFKYHVECRLLSDLNLYHKIENRGYYIKYDDKEFLCRTNIILSGEYRMKESLEGLLKTSMLN